jgi:hypothetical protein
VPVLLGEPSSRAENVHPFIEAAPSASPSFNLPIIVPVLLGGELLLDGRTPLSWPPRCLVWVTMRAVGAMPTELIRWQSAATASRFMVGFGFLS